MKIKSLCRCLALIMILSQTCVKASAKDISEDTSLFGKLKSIFIGDETEELPDENVPPKRGNNSPVSKYTEAVPVSSVGSWYCKHTKGTRPPIPPEMSYITDHGGYYLGKDEKVIYLTFDAGYENGNVERILNTLKAENVPGAFFVLDHLVKDNTALVKRMTEEGHTVCNHTAKHKDMTRCTSKEEFAAELRSLEDCYREKTGLEMSPFYRPPEGKLSPDNLKWADELGYKTIMWSFAYADWDNANQMSPESAVEKIISNTHNGEIILLHPTSKTNADILPILINKWKDMGYRFGTLEELVKND